VERRLEGVTGSSDRMERRAVVAEYGLRNNTGLVRALERIGLLVEVSSEARVIRESKTIILAGSGSFAAGVDRLRYSGLEDAILVALEEGAKLLGISLGMQLLFDYADEDRLCKGLSLIPGTVKRFNEALERVPHRGLSVVTPVEGQRLFAGIRDGTEFYFNHTHFAKPANPAHVLAYTEYGIEFASVCGKSKIFGAQFLPERSGEAGLHFLRNFAELD